MDSGLPKISAHYDDAVRSWERNAPWYRRTSQRLGLQGKLVLCFCVLIAAGLYELSPVKQACLRKCRSPVGFLVKHWRPGLGGAFRLGAARGVRAA